MAAMAFFTLASETESWTAILEAVRRSAGSGMGACYPFGRGGVARRGPPGCPFPVENGGMDAFHLLDPKRGRLLDPGLLPDILRSAGIGKGGPHVRCPLCRWRPGPDDRWL